MSYYRFKHHCKQGVACLLRPLGFVPANAPHSAGDLLSLGLATIRGLGFHPQHVVDIGANRGGWTRTALQYFPDAQFTLVEPQLQLKADAQDLIERANVHWHTAGMGAESGTMMFTIDHRDDSSSFRHSASDAKRLGLAQVPVPVMTLEELLRDSELPSPDIIKIDAEGLDLAVVQGANRFLGQTEVFFLEAGVSQRDFPNSLAAVISSMHSHGYRVFDVTDLNRTRKSRTLWLVELMFVRIGGLLDGAVRSFES